MTNYKKLFIYCDGGARGNPGEGGIGIIIKDETGSKYIGFGGPIGLTTNNAAEYKAAIKALKILLEQKITAEQIFIFLDSSLVVNQLLGKFKIKDAKLAELFYEVQSLEKQINTQIFYQQIPRKRNWEADALLNRALDLGKVIIEYTKKYRKNQGTSQ